MKNIIITLLFLLVLPNSYADQVVAEYNNKNINKSEVEDHLRTALNGQLPNNKKSFDDLNEDTKARVVQEYAHQKVLEDASDKSNIQNSELYKKQLEAAHKQVKIHLYLDHHAKRKVNDDLLKTEYKNHVKALKAHDDIHVHHILVKDENEAQNISDDINSGKISFADAAKKHSLDAGSKDKGGDLGYMQKGQTVPEFEQAAYSLKKGKISKPVKTPYGYHLIKVTDSRPKKIPTFEEIKPHLSNSVAMKIKQQHVADLIGNANVKVYSDKK